MSKKKLSVVVIVSLVIVFILSMISLLLGDWLASNIDVIGIRIAALLVSFAALGASTLFSYMIYYHNRTVSRINDDQNKHAELFRDLQFASSNYSIIEFNDRMLISKESDRYIHKFYENDIPSFHMVHDKLDTNENLLFYTIRIPFKVIDGKLAGQIWLSQITYEKNNQRFDFIPMTHEGITQVYTLYNEKTKRNNLIINLVFNKESNYFNEEEVNEYSKIKIYIKITSIMGVSVEGTCELYFTNPTQIEGDGLHTYKINSSNFRINKKPYIEKELILEQK